MAIQRLNKTWVDGELWDAADDANPIGQKIDEVVDQVNLNTNEIVTARNGEVDLNTRINLSETSAATSAANAAASASAAATSEANALSYKNAAETSATNAATSEANAAASASTATTAKNNALTYSNDSYGWANTAENTQFTDSQSRSGYSSYHFAQKASASAADAANSAAAAAVSETNAANSASAAATSASNAATSEANALSYLNDFKGRYYGAYSSDPTTDPLGNPIDVGDVYYNTTENKLKYWTGSTWDYWSQDADTLDGYHAGNASGNIPISNGTVNTNLNADKVDGFDASQTPAPNVIVPLDANGVLDLSATYVRSNVYTLRRVDLTNATSDYMLQVGEEAYISFSNTTSVPLRIATQSGTYYECHVVCSNTGGTSGGTAAQVFLNPNNTTYSNSFVFAELYRYSQGAGSNYETYSAFRCGYAFTSSVFYITNFVQYKNVKGIYDVYGISYNYPAVVTFSTDWRDTTTPWTSLGTITFPQVSSGYIIVRRIK